MKFDQSAVSIDLFESQSDLKRRDLAEGLDIDSHDFNDWLATERSYWANKPDTKVLNVERTHDELQDKNPTVIIEPFMFDPELDRTELHAVGMRDELLATLGSLGGLLSVRTTTPQSVTKLCYRVSGSVREDASTGLLRYILRVSSEASQRTIWTDRFDISKGSSFDAQEKIVRSVFETFQEKLTDGAWAKIWRNKSTSLLAWESYQRGRYHEGEFKRHETAEAIKYYRKALQLDQHFWPAKIALGFCLSDEIRLGWTEDKTSALKEIERSVSTILSQDPDNFYARALEAYHVFFSTSQDEGLRLLVKVVADNPRSPELLAYLGAMYGHCGKINDEIRQYETALLLTSHPPCWILSNLSIAQATICSPLTFDTAQKAILRDPQNVRARIAKICALVERDALGLAKSVAKEILSLEPTFTSENWATKDCFSIDRDYENIRSKLALVGL